MWETEFSQIDRPYYSTQGLIAFLTRHSCLPENARILDVGCGVGALLFHLKKIRPDLSLTGIDYNSEKIEAGKKIRSERRVTDLDLQAADWLALPDRMMGAFDGILSVHALCCFKDVETAMRPLLRLRPRWIAINSLFYDGPLDVLIHIRSHLHPEITDSDPDGDFNIHSLPRTARVLEQHGYTTVWEPFFPPQPIAPPADRRRGTYTMPTALHERTQFSGPVHLPWHFVLARRAD